MSCRHVLDIFYQSGGLFFKPLNARTAFDQHLYERYTIEEHPNVAISQLKTSVMTAR